MGRIILMALVLAATVTGCNRFPDLTIQIIDTLAAGEPPECEYEVEQEAILFRGVWDLAYPFNLDYLMVPRIESYIVDTSIATQAPQGNISIKTYTVAIKLPDNTIPELAGGLPNPYQVTTSGVIPPSQTFDEVSRGLAGAPMIPSSYRNAVLSLTQDSGFDSIVLDIRANGTTAGGFFQQSGPFSWPVEICTGCLAARCSADEGDGDVRQFDALGCTPGQDATGAYCFEIVQPTTP